MLRPKNVSRHRKGTWLTLLTTLMLAAAVWAATTPGSSDGAFFEGNQAYSQKRYKDAIAHYRAAAETGGASASLLFNLANAYQQQGNAGQAILNYERALALEPANADIQANLERLRKELGLYREGVPIWVRFFETLSLNGWTLLASGAFFAVGLLFLARGALPYFRKQGDAEKTLPFLPFRAVISMLLVVIAVSLTGVWTQFEHLNRAVVTQPDARLLISPFESAESIAPIKEGRVVEILKDFGDFSYVREANGQTGWLSKKMAQPIVPRKAWDDGESSAEVAGETPKKSSMTQQLASRGQVQS